MTSRDTITPAAPTPPTTTSTGSSDGFSPRFSLAAPTLTGEDAASFEVFARQFHCYINVTNPPLDKQLDLLLLCAGSKAATYYDEMTWERLSAEETAAGMTEVTRALDFLRKFVKDRK